MADARANINIGANTSEAVAAIKNLQRQISTFYTSVNKGSAAAQASVANMQQNLINNINATGQFSARIQTISSTTESFTSALEKNKLTMGQYFRYAGAATNKFGRKFTTEINTINKVATERVKDLQTQYIQLGRDANGAMKSIAVRPATLDLKNYSTQTQIAAQKQAIFNQLINQGSTNLLNWGKNTQWAGRQLMVGFTIPLTIFATTAGRAFMQLEQQAIKFKRVYGDLFTTGAETEQALAQMRELGEEFTKFGVAVEETVGLAATVAQMGKTGADLTAQVTEATRLSVLGGMSQEEALNTTIGLTNAFGVSVEELTNKVNFLNAAENQTILSIQDFNEAVPRAGSVVAQLGGDVEDLAFFLTAMREGGVNASQGANALKSSLGRLINPTQRAKDRLREYGIDVTGIVERNTGDLRGTVLELAHALDELAPLEKSRAIETLFGKFQFARMSTLFQNIIKDGSQAATVLDLINSSASDLSTIAGRELGRVEESAATKFTAAVERFQSALAPLGEEFLKLATPIIEFATKILKRFNELSDGAKGFITALTAGIGGFMPVALMLIGLTANLVANIIKGLNRVRLFFAKFRGQTQDIATQTDYLTQQQLESQAVSASLEQAHQRLSQSFTVEADALGRLTQAYNRAIAAQTSFRGNIVTTGGMMSPGGKVRGYNSGVVSVPGQGNEDTVPAMLTPGEAVIPKEMAKKYAPLINAMIAGNIPGYNAGKQSIQRNTFGGRGSNPVVASHLEGFTPGQLQEKIRMIVKVLGEGAANVQVEIGELSGVLDDGTRVVENRMATLGEIADMPDNTAVIAGGSAYRGTTIMESANRNYAYNDAGVGGAAFTLDETAEAGRKAAAALNDSSKKTEAYSAQLQELVAEGQRAEALLSDSNNVTQHRIDTMEANAKKAIRLGVQTDTSIKASERSRIAEERIAEVTQQIATLRASGIDEAELVQRAEATYALAMLNSQSAASGVSPQFVVGGADIGRDAGRDAANRGNRNIIRAEGTAPMRRGASASDYATRVLMDLKAAGVEHNRAIQVAAGEIAEDMLTATEAGILMGLKKETQQSSPSRKARQSGANIGKGAIDGIESEIDDAQVAGQQLGDAVNQGASQSGKSRDSNLRVYTDPQNRRASTSPIGPTTQSNRDTARVRRATYDPSTGVSTQRDAKGNIVAQQQLTQATNIAAQSTRKLSSRFAGLGQKLQGMSGKVMGVSFAASGLIGAASMAGGAVGEFANKLFPLVSVVTGLTVAMQALNTATIAAAVSTRRTAAARAVAEGIIAKRLVKTGGGFTGVIARAGTAVAGFLGPIGLAVAGVALLAAGVFALAKIMKDQKDKIEGLGTAAQMTASRLETINRLTGEQGSLGAFDVETVVTPGEGTGEAASVDRAQMVQTFREDEQFLEDYAKELKALGDVSAENAERTLATIFNKLLLSGYSKDAAEAAVTALANEAERTDIVLDFDTIGIDFAADDAIDKVKQGLQTATSGISELNIPISQESYLPPSVGVGGPGGPALPTGDASLMSQADKESVATAGAEFAVGIAALKELSDQGSITADELQTEFVSAGEALKESLDPAAVPLFIEGMAPSLGMEKVLKDVDNLDQALALINYKAQGLEINTDVVDAFEAGFAPDATQAEREYAESLIATAAAKAESNRQTAIETELETARNAEITAAEDVMEEKIANYKLANTAYEQAIALNLAEADATDIASNASLARGLAAAAEEDQMNGNNEATERFLELYNAMKEAEGLPGVDTPNGGATGSSSVDTSPLDAITKKLRLYNNAQVKVTEGYAETTQEVQNFMDVNGQLSGQFNGLNNQLRDLDLNENLIEMITGMDPDEYEERKNDLFVFDDQGTIIGMTSKLQSMNDALNTATIGEFVSEQNNITNSVGNQITALNKLTAAGASYQAAYRAVKNTALASAIATAKSSREIQEAANAAMEAQQMMERFEEINEEEQRRNGIADAVKEQNKQFNNQAKIIDYINKNRRTLTEAQIETILSDKELQALVLEPSIAPRALQTALDNANRRAELELSIKKMTLSGQQEIWEEGLNKALESFNIQENQLELDFEAKMSNERDIIDLAEQEVAKLEYKLDDYEAGLEEIERQEDVINDVYDKRLEALDKVESANERITRQQQAQLSIADALSRGDIAAAAKAAQEARALAAENAVEKRKESLERSRQAELAGVRSRGGLGREGIETAIRDIEEQIFRIEEDRIEPAQEAIRLAEIRKEADIEALEVLGKTREEWEAIGQKVDMATINNYKFVDSLKEGLAIIDDLLESLGKEEQVSISTGARISSGGGGGGSSKPAPAPPPPPPSPPGPTRRDDDDDPVRVDTPSLPRKVTVVVDKDSKRESTPTVNVVKNQSSLSNDRLASVIRADEGRYNALVSRSKPKPKPQLSIPTYFSLWSGMGGFVRKSMPGPPSQGGAARYATGGIVSNYLAQGGFPSLGSDTIPAMLTPGEFVIKRPAVSDFGVDNLESINNGTYSGGSVYNYNLAVNVKSDSNPDQIARTVMDQIKRVDSQRIRGNRF